MCLNYYPGYTLVEQAKQLEMLEDWRRIDAILDHVATLLKCQPNEVVAKVEQLQKDIEERQKEIAKYEQELLETQ